MVVSPILVLPVVEESQVGEARRRAATMAGAAGYSRDAISNISIIVSELATNLVKHARGGELLVQLIQDPAGHRGIEIASLDKGPGMNDPDRCLQDGYTTTGTLGNGLGAVTRLSKQFDVYSDLDKGTVISVRCSDRSQSDSLLPGFDCISLPKDGEEICGDGWYAETKECKQRFIIADGLGHGFEAADAAHLALRLFGESNGDPPDRLLLKMHEQLRRTRGAAIAVVEIDAGAGSVSFCGVGNIAVTIESPSVGRRHLLSEPGIVGYEARKFVMSRHEWSGDCLLIMHSDGLGSRWGLDQYNGLRFKSAAVIAGTLFRDERKSHDDCTVLVYRDNRAG